MSSKSRAFKHQSCRTETYNKSVKTSSGIVLWLFSLLVIGVAFSYGVLFGYRINDEEFLYNTLYYSARDHDIEKCLVQKKEWRLEDDHDVPEKDEEIETKEL